VRIFLRPGRLALVSLASLCLCACAGGPRVAPGPSASPPASGSPVAQEQAVLLAFGDSLTEGLGLDPEQAYPAQLQRRLQGDGLAWKVVNAGLSGETSSGALSRVGWVLKLKPRAVILETGANDGLRGVDPAVTRDNLLAIVKQLKAAGAEVIIAPMQAMSNLGPDYARNFAAVYPEVAKQTDSPLLPFFLEGVAGVSRLNQEDRMHPTAEGYAEIVKRIAPPIEAWLKGLAPAAPARKARSSP
jgi:acyl-CoA thioesterase-1